MRLFDVITPAMKRMEGQRLKKFHRSNNPTPLVDILGHRLYYVLEVASMALHNFVFFRPRFLYLRHSNSNLAWLTTPEPTAPRQEVD